MFSSLADERAIRESGVWVGEASWKDWSTRGRGIGFEGTSAHEEENDDNNGMIYKRIQSRGEAVEFVSIIIQ